MLIIQVPSRELFNEKTNEFILFKEKTLQLEHSLLSIAKWEAKYTKPFMSKDSKTRAETLDYVRCMTINSVPDETYLALSDKNVQDIKEYIDAPMTATTFNERDNRRFNRRIVTAELVYFWMVANQIPFECQKWHFNRLITLIRVCNIEGQPPKKMGRKETMAQNRSLNAARRARSGSRG